MTRRKVLVITPVKHIDGVVNLLESIGDVTYMDDPLPSEVLSCISQYDAVYTNPNKSRVYIGDDLISHATNLKVICTASTGLNHIDLESANKKNIAIISLTEERAVIEKISSTAELAFTLTMASLRNIVNANNSVVNDEWDYTKYIGRQVSALTVGVLGYGRLGLMYARYAKSFGARVIVYDPYKLIEDEGITQVNNLNELISVSDVISMHVHVTPETKKMINRQVFSVMKSDVLLINTSRGDIIDEVALVDFLKSNPQARAGVDVLADEIRNRGGSPLLKFAKSSNQVIITPHIGGMTKEAQEIAYGHVASLLKQFFINYR